MIQHQVKLRLSATKEAQLNDWLWMLTGVWNWAVRKIEQDAKDGIYYTYVHCKPNGEPFYVGKGTGRRSHNFSRRNQKHKNIAKEFSRDDICITKSRLMSDSDALKLEEIIITLLRDAGFDLANISKGGGYGSTGCVRSDETKAHLSSVKKGLPSHNKGIPMSHEQKIKLSKVMTGKHNGLGKKRTDETRKRMSDSRKGMKFSDDHRANLSLARANMSQETRLKISIAGKGRVMSSETRERMKVAQRLRREMEWASNLELRHVA